MSRSPRRASLRTGALTHPPRAVIDIGSNTVRLVIYEGTARAPEVVWNESVSARLGRDLSQNGAIPDCAIDEAVGALARYALIVADLGIADVQTVATAAARDASNGPEFLSKVRELGLEPRLLSGDEEARACAMGAIGAFPGAEGVVADLGGGSLELVSVAKGESHHAESLPLGTLRLPAMRANAGFRDRIHGMLAEVGWAAAHPGPLYMIGGTWRAFAAYAMRRGDFPLTDPHGFRMGLAEADRLAKSLKDARPDKLRAIPGISPMRAQFLPDAAALLRPLLAELVPDELVFSSWGIREGLLFTRLDPLQRAADPLLAGIAAFAEPRGGLLVDATLLAAWGVGVADGRGDDSERLRLAAAQLSLALHRVEPNLRVMHAIEWALDKRWIDLDPRGRAMICAALLGSLGKTERLAKLMRLASDEELERATAWGLAFRLARRLGGASRMSLSASSLVQRGASLVLRIEPARAPLAQGPVQRDMAELAEWLSLEPVIEISGPLPG